MKRADVRRVFTDATDEQISQILSLVHDELDPVKDEVDSLKKDLQIAQNNKDPEGYESKYTELKKEFDEYKDAQTKAELKTKKEKALKELLDGELSDRGIKKAVKYNLDDVELDDDGEIKNRKSVLKSIKEEWSDFVTEETTEGTKTTDKDGVGKKQNGGKTMTKEEIMKVKDATERQKLIAEHIDLFQ